MTQLQQAARSVSIELMDQLQRRWNAVILSGKPNGLAEKPDLLASLTQVGEEFGRLRTELLDALNDARRHEASVDLGTRAQIAVDILIRNLFERTADVGFLAEDQAIIDSLNAGETADTEALRSRLQAYVAKYSVYDDIAVFDTDGSLHVTLLGGDSRFMTGDPMVSEALAQPGTFHEIFRVLADGSPQLLYVQAIKDKAGNGTSRPIGALALSFRFTDEMEGIFADLMAGNATAVDLAIVDSHGSVIASSVPQAVPPGQQITLAEGQLQEAALAGHAWRALRMPTRGYQGFRGLGWSGVALQPAMHRREMDTGDSSDGAEQGIEQEIARSSIVSPSLRLISGRAYAIDTDLHLIGLNGKIAADRENNRVLPAVLASIREVGESIRNAVYNVVGDLYRQSQHHLRQKVSQMAALGINIMDRNLYERANDCRWWALTPLFRHSLSACDGDGSRMSSEERAAIARTLAYINGLYTVYSNLLVFDRQGRVIAESNAGGATGQHLTGSHIGTTLHNLDPQSYAVSPFEATPLYGGRPTYVYCGTILTPDGSSVVGGIAVVFDSEPQFRQMLLDVMPLREDGSHYANSVAAFVNGAGICISSTDPRHQPGATISSEQLPAHAIRHDAPSQGYREFKRSDGYRDDVRCVIAVSS
jgi:hypothetical protein